MEHLQILSQMIDIELSHILWALVGIIGFFIRNELSKIHKDIQRLDGSVQRNTIDIEKIKTKLEIE